MIIKKYLAAIGIWILMIPLAILNGGLREYVLVNLGSVARPLSGIILSVCIFLVAYFLVPKIKSCTKMDYVIIGILWFVLTNLFDLASYISEGGGFKDLLESYNFLTGNTWVLVVMTALLSPMVVAKIKKFRIKEINLRRKCNDYLNYRCHAHRKDCHGAESA